MEIDPDSINEEQRKNLSALQAKVQSNLERRIAQGLGVVEGAVSTKGETGFVVEIPEVQDLEKAKELLKSTAKVQVFHAKNVTTQKRNRTYNVAAEEKDDSGAPYVTFTRASNPDKVIEPGTPEYEQMIKGWEIILEGDQVKNAYGEVLREGKSRPHFEWNESGTRAMEAWSRKFLNASENLAFVMGGSVLQISPKEDGAILSGGAFINGEFEASYVRSLSDLINSGSIPVDLNILASEKVDPTIGGTAFDTMVRAGSIAMGVIILYMMIYYAFPGIIAAVSLILYCLFTVTVMKAIGSTFSLATVAALLLSVGMAVDANILVFERIKEELRAGRKLATAIDLGFKRALSAILDSNACTAITSIVLFSIGTSAVKGFATALIIGVGISFFTAITVTRSLLVGLTSIGIGNDVKWYGLNRNLFGEKLEASADHKTLNIIGKRKTWFLLSIALIAVGAVFIGLGGIKPNVEFQGGYEATYAVDQNVSRETIIKRLEEAGYKGANAKIASVGDIRQVYITIPPNRGIEQNDPQATQKIADVAGVQVTEKSGITNVGPTIQKETTEKAITGVILSSALIVLYIAFRFGIALGGIRNGLKFGLSAVIALLHDVGFVIGAAAIVGFFLGWEISSMFITAMLTVSGFSVHDTIIIFDRIRENLRRSHSGETFQQICDKSVTQTIARSINTSAAAMLPLVLLLAFGTPTPDLKLMVLVMLLGIGVGTYSSIYNASPILWLWDQAVIKKGGEKAGLVMEAQRESKLRAAQVVSAPGAVEAGDTSAYGTIKRKGSIRDRATHSVDEE